VSTADLLGRQVYTDGHFEIEILADALAMLTKHCGRSIEGTTFVDIGANIGTTVIPAIKTFGAGSAFAFEPETTNLKLLRQNVIENGLDERITVVPIALSDVNKDGTLEIASTNWGDHRVRLGGPKGVAKLDEDARPTRTIVLRRFDDVAEELNLDMADVGLVWMDVQGHEGHVLSGAHLLLQSDVPVVTEYWPYGLRRAHGIDMLHNLISAHYGEVIDLRASAREGRTVSVDSGDMLTLEQRYSPEDYTDLLLLK
jgi:FkbM family methyltransferase